MARVLIVDDSEELLQLFSHFLSTKGYTVATAISENSLFNKISNFDPDIILLDVKLSDADGRKICTKLKNNRSFKTIPIILISANPELLENYKECGADDIIEKPFNISTVIGKIETSLLTFAAARWKT